jgi:class 3 adenylate cyclase
MVEGGDPYGDGVNAAARLESLADSSSVYLSQTVHSQVRGQVPHGIDDFGEQKLGNITEPMRVYRMQSMEEATRLAATSIDRRASE